VVDFCGLRIAGMSGIFHRENFKKGHFEKMPYAGDTKISAFHVREYELWKLLHLSSPIHMMLSHDWPDNVLAYGDTKALYSLRPSFEGQPLGCEPYSILMNRLKPTCWFSAHMHVRFTATVLHKTKAGQPQTSTKFLALDKAMPDRPFIEFHTFEVPSPNQPRVLFYDIQWLAILRCVQKHLSKEPHDVTLPQITPAAEISKEIEWLSNIFSSPLAHQIPVNFCRTVVPYSPKPKHTHLEKTDSQTQQFKKLIGLERNE